MHGLDPRVNPNQKRVILLFIQELSGEDVSLGAGWQNHMVRLAASRP